VTVDPDGQVTNRTFFKAMDRVLDAVAAAAASSSSPSVADPKEAERTLERTRLAAWLLRHLAWHWLCGKPPSYKGKPLSNESGNLVTDPPATAGEGKGVSWVLVPLLCVLLDQGFSQGLLSSL
jgi:hypothetical protein